MIRSILAIVALTAVVVASGSPANADSFTCRTGVGCLNGTDFFDWGDNFGVENNIVTNGSGATSNGGGVNAVLSWPIGGPFGDDLQRRDQPTSWNGNFDPGDELILTPKYFDISLADPPLSLSFDTPLSGIGANIQPNVFAEFTARLEVFDMNDVLIDSIEFDGISDDGSNYSAIFIGLGNLSGIRSAAFRITYCDFCEWHDFAINQLDIIPEGTSVPEPTSLLLLGTGLFGLAGMKRKFRS